MPSGGRLALPVGDRAEDPKAVEGVHRLPPIRKRSINERAVDALIENEKGWGSLHDRRAAIGLPAHRPRRTTGSQDRAIVAILALMPLVTFNDLGAFGVWRNLAGLIG